MPKKKNDYLNPINDFRTEIGFKKLYEEQSRRLFTICFCRISNKEEVEEMVQDIFKSVWERRMHIYNENGSIEKYMARAAKLKVIDHYRKQERGQRILELALQGQILFENQTENDHNLLELESQIAQLVNDLPPKCKEAYHLSRNKGMKNKKIALLLQVTEKTVESHITRALNHLRKNLAHLTTLIAYFLQSF